MSSGTGDTPQSRRIAPAARHTTIASSAAFAFSFGSQTFTLTDGQSQTITDVPPGSYSASEVASSNWRLDSVVCDDPTADSPYSAGSTSLTVSVGEGEDITCVFTNAAVTSPDGTLPDTGLEISWQVLAAGSRSSASASP